jgi:hypothetical protein
VITQVRRASATAGRASSDWKVSAD